MRQKSIRIRERHIAVDLLASLIGAGVFYSVDKHNWFVGGVCALLSLVLIFLDRESIENEESASESD
jgi:hypothetical protein